MRVIKNTLLLGIGGFFCVLYGHPDSTKVFKPEKVVFLTGAAGFIGSNFLEYMFDRYPNYSFLVLDSLTYAGSLENIPQHIKESPRFKFIYGSVTNQPLVDAVMAQANFVVHFAAETHVARSIYDDKPFWETDVMGTRALMDSLVRHKNVERFIHISTSEVCGTAETEPMDERHPLNPRSPYAAAKAAADRLVYSYHCTYGVPVVIVRPFNNFGPRQLTEKLIPRLITRVLRGKCLPIEGSGEQKRDWVHTRDVAIALDKILHHPHFEMLRGQVIHLGSGVAISVLEVARLILKQFNLGDEQLKFVTDRPGQVKCHISSTEKAYKLLGWRPTVSLEDGIKDVVNWYRTNTEWWKKRELLRKIPGLLFRK